MQSFKHCFQTKLMNFFSFSISFCTFASSIGASLSGGADMIFVEKS